MAAPELRRVRSGDGALQLAAYDYGSPASDAPACLLLHGNGLCARAYEPLSARLRRAGFRVVALDQRGAGASTLPACGADLTWQRFAEDALAVVDALQLRRCVGFGHSLGGAAMLLAGASSRPELANSARLVILTTPCAEATRPGTFRALYLFEPVVAPTGEPGVPHPWDARLKPKIQGALNRRRTFPTRQAVRAAHVLCCSVRSAALKL
jgi:pimeloyl-ACP methyl ester carboxylesterase